MKGSHFRRMASLSPNQIFQKRNNYFSLLIILALFAYFLLIILLKKVDFEKQPLQLEMKLMILLAFQNRQKVI